MATQSIPRSPGSEHLVAQDFKIQTLGEAKIKTSLESVKFIDKEEIYWDVITPSNITLECAGPRKMIFFEPSTTKAAIITCGGLCPGMNDVIRALVMALHYRYGVRDVVGYKFGYEGLNPEISQSMVLTPEVVKNLHLFGGTILGTSRGPQDTKVMVKFLHDNNVKILFCIGGDGTLKGAQVMANEIATQGLGIAIVGVPKTIDNDLLYMQKTFGFETAVSMAQVALNSAHTEALSARGGIGIVKLMGRESGFISLYSSVASSEVNLLLIPEVPFTWKKVIEYVESRLTHRGHCLIVVAEGAGQELCEQAVTYDKSGNRVLADIGILLKKQLSNHFTSKNIEHTIKYIDPSYTIRSAPAEPADKVFAIELAQMLFMLECLEELQLFQAW